MRLIRELSACVHHTIPRTQDPEAIEKLGGRWVELGVAEQVRAVVSSAEPHVRIPAAYKAGITLFAKKGTPAAEALTHADELPIK